MQGRTRKYNVMFYKNSRSFALRRTFGDKRQALSVANKDASLERLKSLTEEARELLEDGKEETEVKEWVREQLTH